MRHCATILLLALTALTITVHAQEGVLLRLVQTISLPHVEGRIDHLAVDLQGQRLFVAALGNNTLEVLDLKAGTRLHSITGLHEPQGVVFIPESNAIVVTNGQTGTCDIFDGTSFQHRHAVKLASDADNIRYDVATHTLYVGYGAGALGLIDATGVKHLGDIPLKGHPEAFQLEQAGPRIFVNIPSAHHIAVVDRNTRAVSTIWPLQGAEANFPMALDATNHRLFVSFRKPPMLMIIDTESGKEIARMKSVGDAGVWGVITELPMVATVRLVGEVNGESVRGHADNNSGLLGVLWQPPWLKAVVDAGIRRGFSRGAPDWLFTAGLTLSFPLPESRHE